MSKGMSHFVFVVYSNDLASISLVPCAFFLTRNKRPPITLSFLCKFFLLSIAGITVMQNCVFTGADYSSPALASALANLVPAFTFLLAVTFRMEKLERRSSRSRRTFHRYCLSYSTSNITQAAILKGYSSEITLVSFYCLFGFAQCTIVTLIAERRRRE
ncbi:WAT1-related protein At3g56620-like, partial [Herrania umbratica]|uniref:WAT1-related protein n=1 Tax=Herrania umbratica TaxID=108875 RepID=A0A6J1AZU5_9ROSI